MRVEHAFSGALVPHQAKVGWDPWTGFDATGPIF